MLDRHITRYLLECDRLLIDDRSIVIVLFASVPDISFPDIEASPLYQDFVAAPPTSWSRSLLFKLAIKDVFESGNATVKRANLSAILSLVQNTSTQSVFMQNIRDGHNFLVKEFCVIVDGKPYINSYHLMAFVYLQGVDRSIQCNLTNTMHPSGNF